MTTLPGLTAARSFWTLSGTVAWKVWDASNMTPKPVRKRMRAVRPTLGSVTLRLAARSASARLSSTTVLESLRDDMGLLGPLRRLSSYLVEDIRGETRSESIESVRSSFCVGARAARQV